MLTAPPAATKRVVAEVGRKGLPRRLPGPDRTDEEPPLNGRISSNPPS